MYVLVPVVDLLKTLPLVSSLLQTFHFCFCVFYILVDGGNQYALWAVSVDTSTGWPKKYRKLLSISWPNIDRLSKFLSPVHSVDNFQ